MKRMDYREGSEMLRRAGFTTLEIEQLSKLRSRYPDQEIQHVSGTSLTQKVMHGLRRWYKRYPIYGSIWRIR